MSRVHARWSRHRILGAAAVLSTAALVVTGCTAADDGGEDGDVTLTFVRPASQEFMDQLFIPILDAFHKEHPNITVKPTTMGFDETYQRMPLQAASGDLPDVFLASGMLFSTLAASGALLPLDDVMPQRITKDIPEEFFQATTWDGVTYGVPGHVSPYVLWYNADIFEEAGLDRDSPPATWDELVADAEQIRANTDVDPIGLNNFARNDLTDSFSAFYTSGTGNWLWDPKRQQVNVDDPGMADTLEFMASLVDKGLTQPQVDQYDEDGVRELLRDNKAAMVISSPNILGVINGDASGDTYRPARFPVGPGGDKTAVVSLDSWGISGTTEHPKEALELLDWLTSDENQITISETYGDLPMSKGLWADAPYTEGVWPEFTDQVEQGFYPTKPVSSDLKLSDADIPNMVQRVVNGQMSAQQSVDEFAKEYGWSTD